MGLRYQWKRLRDGLAAFPVNREMETRDTWTRQELKDYQLAKLKDLVRHAQTNSPFYREHLGRVNPDRIVGVEQLPTVDKRTMMENFDRFVTDPSLHLAEIEGHLEGLHRDEYFRGKYRVLSSSGSSGYAGVFVFDRREWSTIVASTMRAGRYSGITPRIPKRLKWATVAAHSQRHATARVSQSADFGLYKVMRRTVLDPTHEIVAALNQFQPDCLTTYPSAGALLAIEQLEGRLFISPRAITVTGEVCTQDMTRKIQAAWGIKLCNWYAMCEAINLGASCPEARGIHLFEDLAIVEVVDENNHPVPDGTPGKKMLLTNLSNRTQPLIRYEVSDMLTISPEPCPCGRPFRVVTQLEGRSDEILQFEATDSGVVEIHPHHFRDLLGGFLRLKQYQVMQEGDGIRLHLVLRGHEDRDALTDKVRQKMTRMLESHGAVCPPLIIEFVEKIERDAKKMGKLRLIVPASNR
jgi:phenylacetate-coenzyme A ligase PaaK-like adenylate-forming protein